MDLFIDDTRTYEVVFTVFTNKEKEPQTHSVEVRVRKNGKRDKYYFPPSSGLKFNSKEVFRYLDNVQNKVSIQKISPNIIVEKAIVEGLPPGWVKKTRITTNGDSVRRDTFYIDPVNGYTFCSIEDVDHYLETGKIGRNEFTSKDKDGSDMELKADKSPSRSVTMKPTLSVSKGQSSDLDMIANDQQIPRSASSEEYLDVPISECISNQCVVGAELTNLVISRAESSDQKQGKFGLAQSASVSGCTNKDVEEKQPSRKFRDKTWRCKGPGPRSPVAKQAQERDQFASPCFKASCWN
eukprot:XP_006587324.2 uncharacterized protein LOC102664718 [Glycine max]